MPLSLLPPLFLSILLVGYSPGPANLFSLAMVIRYGLCPALRMWFGLMAGYATAALVCVLAMKFVGEAFRSSIGVIRYVGAAYLLYLAWRIYRARGASPSASRDCSFFGGYVVQLTNAKMILYELTVYATFVLPYSDRLVDLLAVAALLTLAGPGANLVWLLAGSFLHGFFERHQRPCDIGMAVLLAVCAIWIAV